VRNRITNFLNPIDIRDLQVKLDKREGVRCDADESGIRVRGIDKEGLLYGSLEERATGNKSNDRNVTRTRPFAVKHASEDSPGYFRNALKPNPTLFSFRAAALKRMLLGVAKHFCSGAVSPIEAAIKAAQPN
jgi:hypothetical protein